MTIDLSRTYARRAFEDGLAVIRDLRSSEIDRRDAAWTLQHVARCGISVDERLATDLLNAIAQRLEESAVVHFLSQVLLRRCPHVGAITPGLMRLCDRASRAHLPKTLGALVTNAFEIRACRRALDDDWVRQVAVGRLADGQTPASMLARWVVERTVVPGWIASMVHDHPALVLDRGLSSFRRWGVHRAVPTVQGWRILASEEGERDHETNQREFGTAIDVAVSTLERAIEIEPEGANRVTLARWRVGLDGGGR
jgi:hypothetical protein